MTPEVLAGLDAFRRVAAERSLSAAARRMGVSPAAVSQAIRRLEGRLGVRLFDRTTRSVHLTEAGRRYLERVTAPLAELAAATEDLQTGAGVSGGVLRLTLPHLAGRLLIEPLMADFLRQHPAIGLELLYDDGIVDVVATGLDGGIRLGERLQQDMVAVPLTREFRLGTFASRGYLRRRGAPRTPAELPGHDCIGFRFRTSGALYRWEFEVEGELVEIAVDGPLVVNHWEAGVAAAAAGIGLVHTLVEAADPWVRSGRLVPVLEPYRPAFPGLFFYTPARAPLPLKTRTFVDFLRARLGTPAAAGTRPRYPSGRKGRPSAARARA